MLNKKFLSKIIAFIIILCHLTTIYAAQAENVTDVDSNWPYYNDKIESKAAFVMDVDSSKILYSYNANEKLYPASLTKIMTAIIVLDYVKGNYDDLVTFSYNAVTRDIDKNSVTIGASAGDQLSVKDCLYSLLLPSANDAANALAEYVAGSINDFVLLMNDKATQLGLTNTHFVNPSGLHDDNQYSTASDMAKILQCAINYPIFLQISSSISYRHAPIRKYKNPENSNNQVLNTNGIMVPGSGYYYNNITSGKTGHTSLAGYNLAASAKKNNMHLICVVMGAKTDKIRYNETKSLFDFYFNNYKSLSIVDTDPRFTNPVNTMEINNVDLIKGLNITCNSNAHLTLPSYVDFNDVTSKISFQVEDKYNKYAIGTITYYYENREVAKCTLEGRNTENNESIFTGHLDLSKPLNDTDDYIDLSNNNDKNNTNALIYVNSSGTIVFSSTLITIFVIILLLVLIIALIVTFYIFIINNDDIPIRKAVMRLRRRFRR